MKQGFFSNKLMLITALILIGLTAWAIPSIPHQFYGNVLVNGTSAPNGLTVTAQVNGQTYSTTTRDGTYGFSPNLFFIQDPNSTNTGKTITFIVDGQPTGKTASFVNGGYTKIDFSITKDVGGGDSPITPPASDPQAAPGGGGGGGGGGSGDPYESRLLRVAPEKVQVGEEVIFSALCKWSFGCIIKTEGNEVADMVRSAGFQGFKHTYNTPGEKTVELYWSGTNPTLVSKKTVTVTEKIVIDQQEESETPQDENNTAFQNTANQTPKGNTDTQPENEETPQETVTPTGFFSLGGYDIGTSQLGLGVFAVIIIALIAFFVTKNKKEEAPIQEEN
ncbi:MAG: hypothetical protein NUV57_03230 [archaeon]|nr:hypothetical protein [archaeon]